MTTPAPPLPDAEHARWLLLIRTTGTSALLFTLGLAWLNENSIPRYHDIFENMLRGGISAMPAAQKFLFNWHQPAFILLGGLSLLPIALLWLRARTLRTAVWLAFSAQPPLLLYILWVRYVLSEGFHSILTSFTL
jgi:hypothetical protein